VLKILTSIAGRIFSVKLRRAPDTGHTGTITIHPWAGPPKEASYRPLSAPVRPVNPSVGHPGASERYARLSVICHPRAVKPPLNQRLLNQRLRDTSPEESRILIFGREISMTETGHGAAKPAREGGRCHPPRGFTPTPTRYMS
jgi:hypothetical protein